MKAGRFFQIPERPAELWDLWKQGQPLALHCLPDWLTADDALLYRMLGGASSAGLTVPEIEIFQAEIDELELARLIVERDAREPHRHRVYVESPQPEASWSIGIYQGASPLDLAQAGVAQPVLTAEHVTDVAAAFVADPFLIVRDGRWHMFFEVMNWKANKGEIGLASSDDGLHWRYEQIVLAEEFHLSYPHVFAAADGIYMVPESFQDNSVRLYRATRFPYEWECVGKLLSGGYYVDSSPFQHEGTWWLFTESSPQANDTLRLFYADRLEGPWREHPRSPVVSGDSRHSRPAGRVLPAGFRDFGISGFRDSEASPKSQNPKIPKSPELLRFSQNCSTDYGIDVRGIEITRLTRTEYEERPLAVAPLLGPSGHGWNAGGMHHIDAIECSAGSWLAAVDGCGPSPQCS